MFYQRNAPQFLNYLLSVIRLGDGGSGFSIKNMAAMNISVHVAFPIMR